DKAGTITSAGTYKYGEEVTITAVTTNEGYTFNGWYKNDELYIEDASFDYTIGAEAVAFEARYAANKYTITIDNQAEGVTISGITSGNQYDFDSQIALTAVNSSGLFLVWSVNGNIEHIGNEYTFKVPVNDITIIITTTSIYTREENKIYFGTYPQTKVTATTENGLLSITFDSSTWTSYRYYISSSSQSDFMYYKDVDIDNNGTYDYRGVYFTQYRPTGNAYQDDNGYSTNTIYWFSYDPIEWDILTESSGKALIIANLILDSQEYYPSASGSQFTHNGGTGYANNYELSAIRKFLNDNFYNTAFNESQKALIEITTVDNSAASTGQSSNSYACNNTNDKMFLLSYKEATTYYTSSTAMQGKGSDYAKCQGLYVYSSNEPYYWWLRSPGYRSASSAYRVVYCDGSIHECIVDIAYPGVRPACWINL
ncbi:MAG: InlB B-repeat-containing protein, partial [Bacilli bacterium]|nr:InlB B-repeat-containing protein [Bacilli bacterium]